MSSNRTDKIIPTANTTTIAIALKNYSKFRKVFWNKKLIDFFIKNKRVVKKEIIFEIRSMRINEFVDLLDENNIMWRDL